MARFIGALIKLQEQQRRRFVNYQVQVGGETCLAI